MIVRWKNYFQGSSLPEEKNRVVLTAKDIGDSPKVLSCCKIQTCQASDLLPLLNFSSSELLLHLLHPFSFTSFVPCRVLAECRAPETCMYLLRNDTYSNSTKQAVYKAYWQEPLNCIHKSPVDLLPVFILPISICIGYGYECHCNVMCEGCKVLLIEKIWYSNKGLRFEQKQTLPCIFLISKERWQVRRTIDFFFKHL